MKFPDNVVPTQKPHTSSFMVFSMLLMGVFFATLIFLFDFWSNNDKGLSSTVIYKIQSTHIPIYWIVSLLGLSLLSIGFFLYLGSFFMISIPVFIYKNRYSKSHVRLTLFTMVSSKVIKRLLPEDIEGWVTLNFRNTMMYLMIASSNSTNSANVRFLFTQVMFARSLGSIFIFYAAYICWSTHLSFTISIIVVILTYFIMCLFYKLGVDLFEDAVASGLLIEEFIDKKNNALNANHDGHKKDIIIN